MQRNRKLLIVVDVMWGWVQSNWLFAYTVYIYSSWLSIIIIIIIIILHLKQNAYLTLITIACACVVCCFIWKWKLFAGNEPYRAINNLVCSKLQARVHRTHGKHNGLKIITLFELIKRFSEDDNIFRLETLITNSYQLSRAELNWTELTKQLLLFPSGKHKVIAFYRLIAMQSCCAGGKVPGKCRVDSHKRIQLNSHWC